MISTKYKLQERYAHLEPFLLKIKEAFAQPAELIHDARNQLKILTVDDLEIVVKSFRIPNAINQIAYAYLRDSKAKKSYENALKLQSLGITTPEPVAYIEFYENGLLKESYFLSLRSRYDFTIREPLLDPAWPDHDLIFAQFGEFTQSLHQKEVLHRDYSPGNILISKLPDQRYRFDLVDINRMRFGVLSDVEKMKNLAQLWADEKDLNIIAGAYAGHAGIDSEKTAEAIIFYDQQHKKIKNFKRRLKGKK